MELKKKSKFLDSLKSRTLFCVAVWNSFCTKQQKLFYKIRQDHKQTFRLLFWNWHFFLYENKFERGPLDEDSLFPSFRALAERVWRRVQKTAAIADS